MQGFSVLTLPGWQSSGPDHWQSRWEQLYGYTRVEQHDWQHPLRGDWIMRLEEVVLEQAEPVVLVAHSLGCHLVSAWAALSSNTSRVHAALLVAPGDPQQEELRAAMHSWSPIVTQVLPFKSLMLTSQNDPYCSLARAQNFARQWGAKTQDMGPLGHINTDSELGDWPTGHTIFKTFTDSSENTAW